MVESTSLLKMRTGNSTVGSNPTLTAIFPVGWFDVSPSFSRPDFVDALSELAGDFDHWNWSGVTPFERGVDADRLCL